ncbi:MAG: hypothetical protein IJ009_01150 [Clostridia bacterium]|nr:hypothetical protein [Clostridia bacterium]
MKEKTKQLLQKTLTFLRHLCSFFLNPRFLLCFGIGWMITNGWSYLFLFFGLRFGITWMTAVGSAYMAFLWFPFTPEKILTLIIALFLLRLFFPNDKATLQVLRDMLTSENRKAKKKKNKAEQTE